MGGKGKFIVVIIIVVVLSAVWLSYSNLSGGVDNRNQYSEYDQLNPEYISEELVDENGVLVVVVDENDSPIWFATEYRENETALGLINRLNNEDSTLNLEYFGTSGSVVLSRIGGISPDRTQYTWRFYVNGEKVEEGLDYPVQKADIIVFAVESIN